MYAVLSDIHGNMYAFREILKDMENFEIESVILLGDLIDYGMQSNEVISYIRDSFKYKLVCNIWGNHEKAVAERDFTRFSSPRGAECARHTAKLLTDDSLRYITECMNKTGIQEFNIAGKRCLAVHGSLEDRFWKSVSPGNVRGDYSRYDIVFSGHSHCRHMFTEFYEADDPERRNKHAVMFINPGSAGQPRDHVPYVQYALLDTDTMSVNMRAVSYDIEAAMSLYDGSVDLFYRDRLKRGV